ncbi:unnamed protein product [Urochloa humidicola]
MAVDDEMLRTDLHNAARRQKEYSQLPAYGHLRKSPSVASTDPSLQRKKDELYGYNMRNITKPEALDLPARAWCLEKSNNNVDHFQSNSNSTYVCF